MVNSNINNNFKGIIDTTLREGYQFAKADFSVDDHIKIYSLLSSIGIDYIEVGNPLKPEINNIIKELVKQKNKTKILAHVRNQGKDLEMAMKTGVDGVNILCTVDEERIISMRSDMNNYLERLENNILFAQQNHLEVRVSVEDFFNQPFNNSIKVFRLSDEMKVDRIGLADTLGKSMNWETYAKIKRLRKQINADIEVHFHNDLGLAVSNTVWAINAGANWINTTLLGIGERTGITPLSHFLSNLYVINPLLTEKYNLDLLTQAENYLAKICNVEMPFNLITNQSNAFAHKAGIHLNALMKHGPHKYELFAPRIIGNRRNLIFNHLVSGKTSEADVRAFYELYGIN